MGLTCQYWPSRQKMTVNAVLTDTICSQFPKIYFDSLNICHLRGAINTNLRYLLFLQVPGCHPNFWIGAFLFCLGKLPWGGKDVLGYGAGRPGEANLPFLDNRKAGNTIWKYEGWIVTSSTVYIYICFILLYYFSLYKESHLFYLDLFVCNPSEIT